MIKIYTVSGVEVLMMNKYQKALNETIGTDYEYVRGQYKNIDLLQELVDKSTPMKPSLASTTNVQGLAFRKYTCPHCAGAMFNKLNYCYDCGQKLDWSEDDG